MADARRGKPKRKQLAKDDNSEKPTKEEYAVAKYLRFSAPSKEGKFLGNSVQYFIGSKSVDALLDSKWSAKNTKTNALFTNRVSCANYCERLLEKGFFHRVARPEKRDKKKKPKETPSDRGTNREERKQDKKSKKDELTEVKKDKEIEQKEKKDKESRPADENVDAQKEDSGQEDKKRKKKKLKLEMHDKQVFLDGSDLYVWIYDPVPVKTFIIGLFLVLGAIAVCLFPLWPPEVKLGVYYLSLAGAGFIGVILSLCILRMILFVIVWGLTLGKVTFWLLPNLTEDVGFFDSFRPTYKCEFKDASKKDEKEATDEAQKNDAASEKGEAETHSDGEEAGDNEEQHDDDKAKEDGGSEEEDDEEDERERVEEDEEEDDDLEHDKDENGHSASSNDNGYEIVDADDVEVLGQADLEGSEEEDQARRRKGEKVSKKGKSPESKKTN